MSKFHAFNEAGFTVQELYGHLKEAVESGEGSRRLYIGPVGGEDGDQSQAISVVGIEANLEDGGGENHIYWLYPGDDEWQ